MTSTLSIYSVKNMRVRMIVVDDATKNGTLHEE